MHSRSPLRTSWLALAALGLVAGVASAAGDDSSRPAAASTRSASGVASGIRSVDFGEVAPPGSACTEAIRFPPPASIPVDRGRSGLLDIGRLAQLEIDPDVAYADLDGDGDEEAVVHVVCTYGANGTQDSIHVWTMSGRRPVHVAAVGEPPPSVTGSLGPTVTEVAVSGDRARITWTAYDDDDPNCCPSLITTVSYELDGGRLRRAGRPVTRPAP